MKFRSVFDVIGPVMIGPSSSHTAGAARRRVNYMDVNQNGPKSFCMVLLQKRIKVTVRM